MRRDILQLGHPLLRERSLEVSTSELHSPRIQALIDDLIETMREEKGAGIAAPQVGELRRICVVEVRENPRYPTMPALPLRVWVNPQLSSQDDAPKVRMFEGCLSVRGLRGQVTRSTRVTVRSLDRFGKPQLDEFNGPLAAVASHECDHLDGVLFVDRAATRSLTFSEQFETFVSAEERLEMI